VTRQTSLLDTRWLEPTFWHRNNR